MKKALSALALILFSFIYAQELGKDVSLSKNWITAINLNDNELRLSNGSITNNLNKSTRRLSLDYYLSQTPLDASNPEITGFFMVSKNPIKAIGRNSSISGISLQNKMKQTPEDGIYYQILVLTETNGNIKDIVQLRNQVTIANGSLQSDNATPKDNTAVVEGNSAKETSERASQTDMSGVTDMSQPTKLTIRPDNSISLEKEWKIEIDFKNFMVNIIGGDIANNKLEDANGIILDVYLTKDDQTTFTSNFEGIHISKAPLQQTLGKAKRMTGAKIKTNLRAVPPSGTYYLLLTISEADASGNQVVLNSRTFQNPITF